MSVEKVPCLFDIRRNCPEDCKSHDEAEKWFNNLVKKRNMNFDVNKTPEEILEEMREFAKTNRYMYVSGLTLVREGHKDTLNCEQAADILASKPPLDTLSKTSS